MIFAFHRISLEKKSGLFLWNPGTSLVSTVAIPSLVIKEFKILQESCKIMHNSIVFPFILQDSWKNCFLLARILQDSGFCFLVTWLDDDGRRAKIVNVKHEIGNIVSENYSSDVKADFFEHFQCDLSCFSLLFLHHGLGTGIGGVKNNKKFKKNIQKDRLCGTFNLACFFVK